MPADATALEQLRRQLGDDPPAAIAELTRAELETLAGARRSARHDQAAALERAMDSGLGFVPRMLRGAVKKVIFG